MDAADFTERQKKTLFEQVDSHIAIVAASAEMAINDAPGFEVVVTAVKKALAAPRAPKAA